MTEVKGYPGRTLIIKRNGAVVGAVVSKSISINDEPIDVTTDEDSGFRVLLDEPGTRSIDISYEGVLRSDLLIRDVAGGGSTIADVDIEFPTGMVIRGKFRINGMELSGGLSDKIAFSGTMQSTGAWEVDPVGDDS